MKLAEAADRLSKVEFEADHDWQSYPRSEYRCPDCNEVVAFNLRDLDRHRLEKVTNLTEADASRAEGVARTSRREFDSFPDFQCPGCRRAVRVYYAAWAGGRFTHGHSIRFVVEGAVPNQRLQATAPEAALKGRRGA